MYTLVEINARLCKIFGIPQHAISATIFISATAYPTISITRVLCDNSELIYKDEINETKEHFLLVPINGNGDENHRVT